MSLNVDLKRVAGEITFLEQALSMSRKQRRENGIREPTWRLEGELEQRRKMVAFVEEKADSLQVAV